MRKVFGWFGKVMIAGMIALVILSAFCLFYYSHGIRKTSTTGATDYSWENRWWSLGYEGYAWGSIDEDGYNNPYKIPENEIDILIMGSSHMNANNVSSGYSTGCRLHSLMKESELKYNVYNIGMEGHDFFICSDNLDEALNTYNPRKYVIMESRLTSLSIESMNEVINGTRRRTPAFDSGIVYYLQKIPYFRLFYRQIRDIGVINDMDLIQDTDVKVKEQQKSTYSEECLTESIYEETLDIYMERLSQQVREKNVTLIVFYMPSITINGDGSISTKDDTDALITFSDSCEKYGIEFVDLSDVFLEHYEATYELPFGFSNSRIGVGHLNRTGHALIANKLFEKILEIEGR